MFIPYPGQERAADSTDAGRFQHHGNRKLVGEAGKQIAPQSVTDTFRMSCKRDGRGSQTAFQLLENPTFPLNIKQ